MNDLFIEQEVTIKGEFDLAATLTIPQGIEGKMPAIVIICGTGEGDRDGNIKKLKINLNIYKMLSDFYAGLGFVTLRYDKRGVAKSKGDKLKTGMNDLVDDIISNVEYLKSLPYVDKDRIILSGHSEGCILSTVAHSRYPVAGLILIAGAGVSIKSAMVYQNLAVLDELHSKKGLAGALLRKLVKRENALVKINKLFLAVQATDKDIIRVQMMKFPAKWLREHLSYSDEKVLDLLRTCRIPVLAITGSKDVQANSEDLKTLDLLGNPMVTTVVVPDMDHMLKEYRGEKSVLNAKKQYLKEIEKPISPAFLDELKRFVSNF